jgi:hypothetical protein
MQSGKALDPLAAGVSKGLNVTYPDVKLKSILNQYSPFNFVVVLKYSYMLE